MALTQISSLPHFNRQFQINPECKPYTLRDNGFTNTKIGNFMYKRDLNVDTAQGLVLKVVVDKNIEKLSISTVNKTGLNNINVMKLEDNEMIVEKINFIFDGFIDRDVLIEIK